MKFHKDAMPIPTDPKERRALVKWIMAHPLWTHIAFVPMPPGDDIKDMFEPIEGSDMFKMREPDETWADASFDDGGFHECVEIDPVYVNPLTHVREDDDSLNTEFRVWIEAGGWHDLSTDEGSGSWPAPEGGWNQNNKWIKCHDTNLDCGGPDLESALCELAVRVKFFYGEGRTLLEGIPERCRGRFDEDDVWHSTCVDVGGHCAKCGHKVRED